MAVSQRPDAGPLHNPLSTPSSQPNMVSTSQEVSRAVRVLEASASHPFQCETCSRCYKRREHLRRHARSHDASARLHHCNVCGRSFHRRDHLVEHELSHQPIRLFHCGEPGCNKTYKQWPSLYRHSRSRGHCLTSFSAANAALRYANRQAVEGNAACGDSREQDYGGQDEDGAEAIASASDPMQYFPSVIDPQSRLSSLDETAADRGRTLRRRPAGTDDAAVVVNKSARNTYSNNNNNITISGEPLAMGGSNLEGVLSNFQLGKFFYVSVVPTDFFFCCCWLCVVFFLSGGKNKRNHGGSGRKFFPCRGSGF